MQDYWHRQAHPNGLGLPDSGPEGEGAEARMARFIGAFESEVTFVTNTSHAISIAATSLPLGPGDEVIIPEREFPAVVYPFLYAAGLRGFAVRFARWRGYGPSPEDLEASMTTNTKVLCMSWVQYQNGYTHDLSKISKMCRQRGVRLVVDAIQGLGIVPLDVKTAGVDILGAGSYKWLMAGTGIATLYVRREVLPEVVPTLFSYRGTRRDVEDPEYKLDIRDDIGKFDLGAGNMPGLAALRASLDFIESIGVPRISGHARALAKRVNEGLRNLGYQVNTREGEQSPIVAFSTGNRPDDEELLSRLKQNHVWTCIRGLGIRIAPHIYCTEEDVELLLAACKR
jgi:selenocysteine lyase/cysteine desulfurase